MAMENIDDRVLVSAYINGDEQAFETLLMRHKDKIYRFIAMKVRDNALAEDIFQDAFIKIVNTLKAGNYNEEGKFLPWAMRIAHNLVIDHFRKNKRMPKFEGSDDFNIFSVIHDEKLNAEKQIIKDQIESDYSNQLTSLSFYFNKLLIYNWTKIIK